METIISDFQKNIEKIFGGRLKSIILYGSSVTGSAPPPRDINIMVVADSIEEEDLLRYRSVAGRYQKKGISNPIFMEADFFKNSANIFPLEYTEIKRTGKVISGSDPFADLEIDMRNLGYQVEFELRGKLLLLRKIFFATPHDGDLVPAMNETISSLVTLARGILIITGRHASGGWDETVKELTAASGIELEGLREIIEMRARKKKVKQAAPLFLRYMDDVGKICGYVSGLTP